MKNINILAYAFIISLLCISYANTDSQKKRKIKDVGIKVIKKPSNCAQTPRKGDMVTVDYEGKLEDGTIFDTSRAEGRVPITFKFGAGKVIPGWEIGLKDMCVGERRELVIPSHLAYGDEGIEDRIPGKATLIFDVELKDIQEPSALTSVMSFVKFASVPVALSILIFLAYQKYQANKPAKMSKKQMKEEKRAKNKKAK